MQNSVCVQEDRVGQFLSICMFLCDVYAAAQRQRGRGRERERERGRCLSVWGECVAVSRASAAIWQRAK